MADVLDKKKPYGVIRGQHKARFYQKGKHYGADGKRVLLPGEKKEPEKPKTDPEVTGEKTDGEQGDSDPTDTVIDEHSQADNVPLESVHWQKLKKMVEEAGGEYTGKKEAIAFLKSKA